MIVPSISPLRRGRWQSKKEVYKSGTAAVWLVKIRPFFLRIITHLGTGIDPVETGTDEQRGKEGKKIQDGGEDREDRRFVEDGRECENKGGIEV